MEAHEYVVNGKTPLGWTIDRLRATRDKTSGITRDPNRWHTWAERPYNLIEHLRRLITVSVRTVRTVDGLPPSLPPDDPRPPADLSERPASKVVDGYRATIQEYGNLLMASHTAESLVASIREDQIEAGESPWGTEEIAGFLLDELPQETSKGRNERGKPYEYWLGH